MASPYVELGFAEKLDDSLYYKLLSPFFPSKIGGKPAWLSLKNIPTTSQLSCTCCDQMKLLCQLYAPLHRFENCFHRTIFVFVCSKCIKFTVWRCQLPKINEFYNENPLLTEEELDSDKAIDINVSNLPSAQIYQSICQTCGCYGPLKCSKCSTFYCSRAHQIIDWKSNHKSICNAESKQQFIVSNTFLFPEFEIINEPEDVEDTNIIASKASDNVETDIQNNYDAKDLEQFVINKEDTQFLKFQKTVASNPDQIIRYSSIPLWISSKNIPNDIPKCSCGSNRKFEFQIMPQLLNFLSDDNLDWGVLAIYTCVDNCQNSVYNEEVLIKQDIIE